MANSKTGDLLDFELLKRVMVFARPYSSKLWLAAIFAIFLAFLAGIILPSNISEIFSH